MMKIGKAFSLILTVAFLCQNMAFGSPKASSMLRIPLNGTSRVKKTIDASLINYNVDQIFSPDFRKVLITESIGGNAGKGHVAVNGVIDATGRILLFGNFQNLTRDIQGKLNKGGLYKFTIRVKLDDRMEEVYYEALYGMMSIPPDDLKDILASTVEEANRIKSEQLQLAQTILKDTKKPGVGHIGPVAAAYEAARLERYDEAYKFVMKGLSGKDAVVNMETAVGVLKVLMAHYGVDTKRGRELSGVLRQFLDASKVAEAKKKFSIDSYRPAWTFRGWAIAKNTIYERFKTTNERKEALSLVRKLMREIAIDNVKNASYSYRPLATHIILKEDIFYLTGLAKDIEEFRILINIYIKLAKHGKYYRIGSVLSRAIGQTKNVLRDKIKKGKMDIGVDEIGPFLIDVVDALAEEGLVFRDSSHAPSRIAEVAKDMEEFKELCISIVTKIERAVNDKPEGHYGRRSDLFNGRLIHKAVKIQREYGDFNLEYSYKPAITHIEAVKAYEGEHDEDFIDVQEKMKVTIDPLSNLSNFKSTLVLFLDTEVTTDLEAFKEALQQLRQNKGNIPVVLLTEETKDTIIAKIKGINLKDVQFRTQADLGLQDLQWDKDKRVSDIAGIDNLKCIPLTQPLCEKFKDLQKARDQV